MLTVYPSGKELLYITGKPHERLVPRFAILMGVGLEPYDLSSRCGAVNAQIHGAATVDDWQ
jgi:hypothetical protein